MNVAAVAVVVRMSTSFTDSRYSATPRSSTDGCQATEIEDSVEPDTLRLLGAAGGLVSAQAVVVPTALARGEWLPAASYASTEIEWAAPQTRPPTQAVRSCVTAIGTPSR